MNPFTIKSHFAGKRYRRIALPAFLFVAAAPALFTGCATIAAPVDPKGLEYEDRCYIEDSQFAFADQMYDRVGSLQLVEQELKSYYQWKPCEINEAVYRLRKVHDLP